METWQVTVLSFAIGSVPAIISMFLPRRGTIKFGIYLYKILGTVLGQKRATQIGIPASQLSAIVMFIRTTFTDLSFGVYIASREDITEENRTEKIDEYLNLHVKIKDKDVS